MAQPPENDKQPDRQQRLEAVERKLNLLIFLGFSQAVLLTTIFLITLANQLIPQWSTLLLLLLTVGVIGYIFRKQLPAVLKYVSNFLVSKLTKNSAADTDREIQ